MMPFNLPLWAIAILAAVLAASVITFLFFKKWNTGCFILITICSLVTALAVLYDFEITIKIVACLWLILMVWLAKEIRENDVNDDMMTDEYYGEVKQIQKFEGRKYSA